MEDKDQNLAFRLSCYGFDSQHSQSFSEEKIVGVAEVRQQRCFVESEQWLENVYRTCLVFTSGKLVLQKRSKLANADRKISLLDLFSTSTIDKRLKKCQLKWKASN